MAAQPEDAASNGDAIIDIVEATGAGPSSECPVCMEPAESVAVGPCGHGEVCVDCAVRLRFHEGDWRCCICRAFCPIVVVTKNAAAASGQHPQEGSAFPKPPLAVGGAGREGTGALAYHSGMAAYFDDEGQYEKARRMCLEPARSLGAVANNNRSSHAPPQDYSLLFQVILFLSLAIAITLFGCGTGALVAMSLFGNWGQRIPVVIAGGFLFDFIAYIFWKC